MSLYDHLRAKFGEVISNADFYVKTDIPLVFEVINSGSSIMLRTSFCENIIEAVVVKIFLKSLKKTINFFVNNIDAHLNEVPLANILCYDRGKNVRENVYLHGEFLKTVKAHREKTAIIYNEHVYSYRKLNEDTINLSIWFQEKKRHS